MKENLDNALRWVLAHEGGYVNHPKDPGGATNMGVTQRTYDGYRKQRRLPPKSVRAITAGEVADIYKRQYWDAVRGDDLPAGLDYAMFDYAVNSGTKRAGQELQRILGFTGKNVDGIVGQITLGAVAERDAFDLIEELCNRRMEFLRRLKHWPTFGRGWTARVMGTKDGFQQDDIGVIDRAIVLARGDSGDALPRPVQVGENKAYDQGRESMTQSSTLRAAAAGGGTLLSAAAGVVTELEGTNQTVALVMIGIVALSLLWIAKERIRKWLDGDT